MHAVRHVALLVGTLNRHSHSSRLAEVLAELAPADLRLEAVDISRLTLYDPRRDAGPPADWVVFRQQIQAADGVLFVASEPTRKVPVVLRNALEIAAHPHGCNAWTGKPAAVVSITPNGTQGSGTCRRLQQRLSGLDVPVMPQPRAALGQMADTVEVGGRRISRSTRRFLEDFVTSFDDWVRTRHFH